MGIELIKPNTNTKYCCSECGEELSHFQNWEYKYENCIDGKVYDISKISDEEIEELILKND